MNEKIKLFAKQAEQYALDKANEGNDEDYDYSFDDDFQEKFAELIVRECIDICKERHWTWRWDETTSGPNECANIIKERFGVEE